MDLPVLAERLINIDAATGFEAAIAEEIEAICRERGFACERETVEDKRWNVYVNWTDTPPAVFCTHLDTVPPFFPARREGDLLFGRGACDTRGIMACMLAAGERLRDDGRTPAYLFVVGEETDSIGAKIAAASGRKAGYIIVGEPTENKLARGHKGTLAYQLVTEGIAGHSAYPERSRSAVHVLLDLLADIRSADWGDDPVLGRATTNIGMIEGGVAPNVTAPAASARVVHRIVDSVQKRVAQLEHLCEGRATLVFASRNEPQFMYCPEGFETTTVHFGTDIPHLRKIGTPLLVGPGSIHDAHAADEKISIAQMREAVDLYTRLFLQLLDSHA
jgi:acetylornithine deacetylase